MTRPDRPDAARDGTIVRITGGDDGVVSVPYADVLLMADGLEEAGRRGLARAGHAGAVVASPHLLTSAPFSPATAAAAEAALGLVTASLTTWSAGLALEARATRVAARALVDADELVHAEFAGRVGLLALAYGREDVAPRVTLTDLHAPFATAAPASLAGLVEHLAQVAELSDEEAGRGTVEIQTLTGADGRRRHIVYLPGLDDLDPLSVDGDVRDVGAAVNLEAGRPGAYGAGIVRAMGEAGVLPGEQVLLVGHSQGGMQAVQLAVQGTPYDITQVVTLGSPHVPGDLPAGVHVLSLEHLGDPIPLLDAGAADDSSQHVTVTFDDGIDGDPFANHHLPHYAAGAAATEQSTDPTVAQAVGGLDPFLGQPGDEATSATFRIVRGDDEPHSPAGLILR
jgi:pimeloyl-ACP methyl ester carboxylesterase